MLMSRARRRSAKQKVNIYINIFLGMVSLNTFLFEALSVRSIPEHNTVIENLAHNPSTVCIRDTTNAGRPCTIFN